MSDGICPSTAFLAVIDWQQRLYVAMDPAAQTHALARAGDLCWLARSLDLPVVASEQYPMGLGPTVDALSIHDAFAKTTFSAMGCPDFAAAVRETGRSQVIVTGMETHICVAQTARDLLGAGLEVWVVADACLSRRRLDWDLGIDRMRGDGARIVTAEAVMFELVGEAGGPIFKELSARIR